MTTPIERFIVTTADGSTTLYVPQWGEHYHSVHGAIQESNHVFIQSGLQYYVASYGRNIRVLEVGLGTGLNAWLTAKTAASQSLEVSYTALEAYPLTTEEASLLNYAGQEDEDGLELLRNIHSVAWGEREALTSVITLRKLQEALQQWQPDETYDLIYFDAFAPTAQPELWSEDVFRKLFEASAPGAVLVTYCAKGVVRRAMKAAGWQVNKIPGPPGKREMTRAIKQ